MCAPCALTTSVASRCLHGQVHTPEQAHTAFLTLPQLTSLASSHRVLASPTGLLASLKLLNFELQFLIFKKELQ